MQANFNGGYPYGGYPYGGYPYGYGYGSGASVVIRSGGYHGYRRPYYNRGGYYPRTGTAASRTRTRLKRKSASKRCCWKLSGMSGQPMRCVSTVPITA